MNSSNNIRIYEGEDWEKRIQLLLKIHYKVGNYQEVPARHKGDFGIEGYSTCGVAYQCYAAEEPRTTNDRYEAQRDKITADIGKFINNKSKLIDLFGETVINRWILIVPIFDSSSLAQHASKKTKEVLLANLPYVSSDFKVIIGTDDLFAKQINELTNVGVIDIDIPDLKIETENREDWLNSNSILVQNLEMKGQKISQLKLNGRIEDFKRSMVDHYLRGQNLLDYFNENNPELYAQLSNCKRTYENELYTMSLISSSSANQHLGEAQKEYSESLKNSATKLPVTTIQILVWEAISDWLMRCPLDF